MKNHPELKEYSFIFETYYKLFQAFTNTNYEVFYFDYKDTVKKYSDKFSNNELIYLNKKLIDYCILKEKTGRKTSNFEEELFNVYSNIIDNNFFINNIIKHLSVNLYRNILILALRLKKYDWAEEFVKNNVKKIHPTLQINIYNYSLAMIAFEKDKYENVLTYLHKIKLDNFDMKIDVKNMMVKVYYKMNYLEEVTYAIYSYKEFLRYNDDISTGRKRSHNNFLKFTKDLVKLKTQPSDTFCEFTKKRINNAAEIVSKSWLLECIDEIKKNIDSAKSAINKYYVHS